MKPLVRWMDTLPATGEIVCAVSWTAPNGAECKFLVRIKTPLDDLPTPAPTGAQIEATGLPAGMAETPPLPKHIKLLAVEEARKAAGAFASQLFELDKL